MTNLDTILESIIEDSATKQECISSVSIANKVKLSGYWVKTSNVADFLRSWHIMNDDRYTHSQVSVKRSEDGQCVTASIYHPINTNKDDFDVEAKAITPQEFELINKPMPLPALVATTKVTSSISPDGGSMPSTKKTVKKVKAKATATDKNETKEEEKEESTVKLASSKKLKSMFTNNTSRQYDSFNFL